MAQVLKLTDMNFKTAAINTFQDIKKKEDIMNKQEMSGEKIEMTFKNPINITEVKKTFEEKNYYIYLKERLDIGK